MAQYLAPGTGPGGGGLGVVMVGPTGNDAAGFRAHPWRRKFQRGAEQSQRQSTWESALSCLAHASARRPEYKITSSRLGDV